VNPDQFNAHGVGISAYLNPDAPNIADL